MIMVTTSTATVSSTATITNNGNMLLYNNNNPTAAVTNSVGVGGSNNCNSSTLEQYRLQLYNYALNMERLRGPPYTAAAMAAAAAYASSTTVATTSGSGQTHHANNYTTPQAPPPPSSYICATATGLIAASSHISGPSAAMGQCPTSNRLALASMSLFPQRIFQPEEPKPQHSYIGLIAMAILSSAETKLVLSDIYQYILDNYPYFRTRGPGWRNSIRHNLSLNDCFIKSGRSANGKGHYWAIHPANMEDFRKGDFRRRKAQRKVRKHMGLAVDDNGTDSPSPPPAMDLTSTSPPSSFQQHCTSVMGGAITPLATAAQQLAAHSFGWRLTQHHRQQTAQHATGSQSGASYMGQIFTYRPQQHYAAAAAAAAALCNGGSTQQHQQQQHLIATTNHQQHQTENSFQNHKNNTAYISSSHDKSEQRQSSSLSSTSVNVINEIFSQKRKRQFDVASLLAPDNSHKREHHPYLRHAKPESPQLRPLNCRDNVVDDEVENPSANDLDIEDIDVVVASEDEDIEADYEHDNEDEEEEEEEVDDEDSNCNSQRSHDEEELDYRRNFDKVQHSKSLKNDCEDESTRTRVQEYEPVEEEEDDDVDDHNNDQIQYLKKNNNNNDNNCDNNKDMGIYKQNHPVSAYELFANSQNHSQSQPPPRQLSPAQQATRTITPSPPPPIMTQILEASDHHHHHSYNQLPLNDAHHLFGRYYGTYMAAAAAARINCSIPTNIVGNTD